MPSVLPRSVRADADLPGAGLQRRHLLRDLPHRGEDQPPGELGGGIRRRAGMLARRHDDAEPRAGVDVDVRIDAALADQPELRQPLEQRRADLRALADQHQRLGVLQALGERVDVLDVVVPDRDVVAVELARSRRACAACRGSRRGSRSSSPVPGHIDRDGDHLADATDKRDVGIVSSARAGAHRRIAAGMPAERRSAHDWIGGWALAWSSSRWSSSS